MEIYTYKPNPFRLGGTYDVVKTEVEKYERIPIGKNYFAIIVKNPVKKLWHIAEESSGALIGTGKERSKLIKKVLNDVETGNKKVMEEQIKRGKQEVRFAAKLPPKEFFSLFRNN